MLDVELDEVLVDGVDELEPDEESEEEEEVVDEARTTTRRAPRTTRWIGCRCGRSRIP